MRLNYTYSKKLLALAEAHRCPFLYASSAAVYGDGRNGFREEPTCEDARTPYAFSKWAFDQHVHRTGRSATVPVVGLRYFNVYGPGEGHKGRMASVAWHCFGAVRRGEAPRLFEGSDGFLRGADRVGSDRQPGASDDSFPRRPPRPVSGVHLRRHHPAAEGGMDATVPLARGRDCRLLECDLVAVARGSLPVGSPIKPPWRVASPAPPALAGPLLRPGRP